MNFELKIPTNLNAIIQEEEAWESGVWVDKKYNPIDIVVDESSFQLSFPAWEDIGKTTDYVKANDLDWSGYDWSGWILGYLNHENPALKGKIFDDSEGETCVLYTADQDSFEKLVQLSIAFMKLPDILKNGIDSEEKDNHV